MLSGRKSCSMVRSQVRRGRPGRTRLAQHLERVESCRYVTCSGADSIGHGGHVLPHFYKWLGTGGHREYKNSKQETDRTVLTITKALTKTTNFAFRAKKVEGHDQKKFFVRRFAPDGCPPIFKFVPAPSATWRAKWNLGFCQHCINCLLPNNARNIAYIL